MNLILVILMVFFGWLLWHSGEFQPCKNNGTQIICVQEGDSDE